MHWMLLWCVEQIKRLKKNFDAFSFGTNTRLSRLQSSVDAITLTSFAQVYKNAGDPNGVVSVPHTNPAICIDTTNNILWTKTDGVASNTGWGSP